MSNSKKVYSNFTTDVEKLRGIESAFETKEWAGVSSIILEDCLLQAFKYNRAYSYLEPICMLFQAYMKNNGSVNVIDFGGGCGQILGFFLGNISVLDWGNVKYKCVDSKQPEKIFKKFKSQEKVKVYDAEDGQTSIIPNPLYHSQSTFETNFDFNQKNTCDILICSSVSNYILDQLDFLKSMSDVDFEYFVLSRTIFSETAPFGGVQKIDHVPNGQAAVWYLNIEEVIKIFTDKGHSLVYQSDPDPIAQGVYDTDWPEKNQNLVTYHLIFENKKLS